MEKLVIILKGGSGSGDWGHVGRAGKRGGSGGGGGKGKPRKGRRSREVLNKEIERNKKKDIKLGNGKVTDNVKNLIRGPNESKIRSLQDKFHAGFHTIHPDVANNISKITGVDEIIVEDFATGWNSGDNSHKFAVINAINKELGVEFSPYEKGKVDQWVDGATNIGLMEPDTLTDYKKIAKATYDETQRQLKELDIDEVILYRGFKTDISGMNKGDVVKWHGNALDSWSTDIFAAESFAGLRGGMVIKTSIPVNRIFSMSSSGPGTTSEREMTVLGNGPNDDVMIVDIISG